MGQEVGKITFLGQITSLLWDSVSSFLFTLKVYLEKSSGHGDKKLGGRKSFLSHHVFNHL